MGLDAASSASGIDPAPPGVPGSLAAPVRAAVTGRFDAVVESPWPGLTSLIVCVAPHGVSADLSAMCASFDAVVVVRDPAAARQVLSRLGADPPSAVVEPVPPAASPPAVGAGLSVRERALLACLGTGPRRVWTYHQLYDAVWGGRYLGDPGSVYSAVKRLRAKLRAAGSAVQVESVRGVGLVLREA